MMDVSFATTAASADRDNEDFFGAGPRVAVLLDGAGTPAGADDGCSHGVAWFARQLGFRCLAGAGTNEDLPLADVLGEAIEEVARLHAGTCDLAHPGSPSSTVMLIRQKSNVLEYLVLADSVLVVSGDAGTTAITDDREATFADRYRPSLDVLGEAGERHDGAVKTFVEALRDYRNREGGFWVATADPAAAAQALTGHFKSEDAKVVALLSDGASRPIDRFGLATWDQAVTELQSEGPGEWLRTVRRAELDDPHAQRWPRTKVHDDATAAIAIPNWS